jgi:hypothetical protein
LIEVEAAGERLTVKADLPRGSRAYLDRDWLPAGRSGPVPALLVRPDGMLQWSDGPPVAAPDGVDPDRAAALTLLDVAREAAGATRPVPPASVEVAGTGVIASAVRSLIHGQADDRSAGPDRPQVIVDASGDRYRIVDATRRLADLGTLVLVGESLGRPLRADLYPDVHRRGLTLVGVGIPLHDGGIEAAAGDSAGLVDGLFSETLRDLDPAAPLAGDGLWYRLSA